MIREKTSWNISNHEKYKYIEAHRHILTPKFGDNLNKYLETKNNANKRSIECRESLYWISTFSSTNKQEC